MDYSFLRRLLEMEVNFLCDRLHEVGIGILDTSPNQDGTLSHLTLEELKSFRAELRVLNKNSKG